MKFIAVACLLLGIYLLYQANAQRNIYAKVGLAVLGLGSWAMIFVIHFMGW